MTKFDFEIPEKWDSAPIERKRVRDVLKRNIDKCRLLLLLYKNKAMSNRELCETLKIDRLVIYNWVRLMADFGLILIHNGKEIIFSNNHSDVTNIIREKYIKRTEGYDFNKKMPIYYYSITKKGEEFIPFACECLGIVMKENNDKQPNSY